jgi:hypothetical protein
MSEKLEKIKYDEYDKQYKKIKKIIDKMNSEYKNLEKNVYMKKFYSN